MPKKSLVGKIYGDIKAIEYIGDQQYKCQCIKCGAISKQYSSNLKGDKECKECGKGYRIDLAGNQYGFLTVKEYNKKTKKWICECKCGRMIEVKSNNLKHNNTQSCGKCKYIESAQKDVVDGTRISQINKAISKNNTSGITGVGYNKRKGKWYASIRFCGKKYWLGYHDNKENAVIARKEAEDKLYGGFLDQLKESEQEKHSKK